MRAITKVTVVVTAFAASSFAQAEHCQYVRYTPIAVQQFLTDALPSWGIGAMKPDFAVTGVDTTRGRNLLTRGTAVVAEFVYTEDPLRDESRLDVLDAQGEPLMTVSEEIRTCPLIAASPLCKRITIRTVRDTQVAPLPFEVVSDSASSFHHFYYGRPVGWGTFADQFNDSVNWLQGYLQRTPNLREVLLPTKEARLKFAVATDPVARQYTDLFQLSTAPYDTLVITGIIPSSEVYDIIWHYSRAAGYKRTDLRARIDTRYVRVDMAPRLYRCR